MIRSLCLVVALSLVGCGGDDEKPAPAAEPVCEAGRVVECPCEGGATAIQECKADGSAWGACSCADPGDVPALACTNLRDQSRLIPSDRCPVGQDMYSDCEASVVSSGVCFRTPALSYCCTQD